MLRRLEFFCFCFSASVAARLPVQARHLAQLEYDWLAAVVERLFFVTFVFLFVLTAFGINLIGLYYWFFTTVDLVNDY